MIDEFNNLCAWRVRQRTNPHAIPTTCTKLSVFLTGTITLKLPEATLTLKRWARTNVVGVGLATTSAKLVPNVLSIATMTAINTKRVLR